MSEKQQREIALMIVDALWNSKWIRLALQTYEYHGKGFDSLRQMFGRTAPESMRPNMPAVKHRLEELVLQTLADIQIENYRRKRVGDKPVTAAQFFRPNKRRMVTYGLDVDEVALTRYSWMVFERNENGRQKYLEYLESQRVRPQDVIEFESV
jgi:hypothetical protein